MRSVPSGASTLPSIEELDTLQAARFEAAVGPLFEGAPRFLGSLADSRPFGSVEVMFERALALVLAMPERAQVELLDAHPRLGAPPGSVSALSFIEQGYGQAAADAAAEGERARVAAELERLNEAYESRFGFRYCVFVAGRARVALLPGFRAALAADRASELRRALTDVVAIAGDRYRRLAEQEETGP